MKKSAIITLAALLPTIFVPTPTTVNFSVRLSERIVSRVDAPRVRAESEPSGERFADAKTDIYNKMLNTIDYLDRVNATVRTNMLGAEESLISFRVDIGAGLSWQSVAEKGEIVSETFGDIASGMTAVNHIAGSYRADYLPVYTRDDTPYIALDRRVTMGEDGIPSYVYRRNITNCPLASYFLLPQEIAFSYLEDFGAWELEDEPIEYVGRTCVVICGAPSPYLAAKHRIDSFRMIVDKETGVLLSLEETSGGEIIQYMETVEIDFGGEFDVKQFNASDYEGYESIS